MSYSINPPEYFIEPNALVQGVLKTYGAWEFKPMAPILLAIPHLVCIVSLVMLPRRYFYSYIGYHKNMMDFLKSDIAQRTAYSYIFVVAPGGPKEAMKIIRDIKRKRPKFPESPIKHP
ncbi:hypothetical protein CLV94_2954 [Flavobacterium endophyticum]|uniref:Uncharacterized protein n=1 Tax=Flavobacterium endophyticum TaxID=1540163 RepID=A0A495M0S8_9FLAO|nr:hypothetical protein CLV94_2954 [Flavobacterium endophyticum]